MQDVQSRLFGGGGGGGGGGDRRLRLASSYSLLNHHDHHNQALKCPRCDSSNTKFCYYNNYNFSQPRHFCKSCRRYWTKGGVLRNVPVGGGCRKSKRSSSKPKPNSPTSGSTPPHPPPPLSQPPGSSSHSSSDSSNLTITVVEAIGGAHNDSKLFLSEPGLGFEPAGLLDQAGMFPDIGSFTTLMTSSYDDTSLPLALGTNNYIVNNHEQQLQQLFQAPWNQQNYKVIDDRSAEVVESGKGFGPLDWQGINGGDGESGMFDLPLINAVDQVYWNQTHWITDPEHSSLYFP